MFVIFCHINDIFLFFRQQTVWGLFRTRFSVPVSASFAVYAYPALIPLYIKTELITTVLDGHTMLFEDLGNKLNQSPFSFFGNVFALEVTI